MERQLTMKVKENSYTIESPTIGNLIDIEMAKSIFSKGKYGDILQNRTWASNNALDIIDALAHLSIMCPAMMKDMAVDDWTQLDPVDAAELNKTFKKQFVPWFDKIIEAIKEASVIDDEDKS